MSLLKKLISKIREKKRVCSETKTFTYMFHIDYPSKELFDDVGIPGYDGTITSVNESMRYVSCCALKQRDINLLASAPYLVVPFRANSYGELLTLRDRRIAEAARAAGVQGPAQLGPIYLFAAKDLDAGDVACYLHIPMRMPDNTAMPNYAYQAIASRWLRRILFNALYATEKRDPCISQNVGRDHIVEVKENYTKLIFWERVSNTEFWRCDKHRWYLRIGCFSASGKGCVRKDDGDKKNPNYAYFSAFRVAQGGGGASGGGLILNALPTGLSIYPECSTWLVSQNGNYVLALESSAVVIYYNPDGTGVDPICDGGSLGVVFSKPLPRRAVRLTMTEGVLRAYCEDDTGDGESQCWFMPVAKDGAEEPLVMILENDGTLAAYDQVNRSVPAEEQEAKELSKGIKSKTSTLEVSMPSTGAFDALARMRRGPAGPTITDEEAAREAAIAEYRRRLVQLKAYLDIRGLLTAFDREFMPLVRTETIREVARVIGTGKQPDLYSGGTLTVPPYDPEEDYVRRRDALMDLLERIIAKYQT